MVDSCQSYGISTRKGGRRRSSVNDPVSSKATSERKPEQLNEKSQTSFQFGKMDASPQINNAQEVEVEPKLRSSSFNSTSSPWFRRNSFLSSAMIENENFSVYESPSYYSQNSSYNIISLKECQGFIFNQDLFASPYQQSRSIANERRYRASFSHHPTSRKSKSSGKRSVSGPIGSGGESSSSTSCYSLSSQADTRALVSESSSSMDGVNPGRRRHTSYLESRPTFFAPINDSAIMDDDDDDHNNEQQAQSAQREQQQPSVGHRRSNSDIVNNEDNPEDNGDESDEEVSMTALSDVDDDEVEVDEYDEFEDDEYGESGNSGYKVRVTEIIVNENDANFYPKIE